MGAICRRSEWANRSRIFFCHKEALFAHLGQQDKAWESLEKWVVNRPGIDTVDDETGATKDVALLEEAILVRHYKAAEFLVKRLSSIANNAVFFNRQTCIGRHLGAAAAMLGRPDEALIYYDQAIEVARKLRFRPEIALIRMQQAELIINHYPDQEAAAIEYLDFAIAEFQEMKMQPSHERAIGLKETLKDKAATY
jgi:tetratricopeptide (TPR) repeat protein